MKILVVHEVNYLKKIIYEFQILPEILSMLGHDVTVIDYDDSWETAGNGDRSGLRTRIYVSVHRAYAGASVTVRRPGMIRLPVLSRVSAAITSGIETYRFLRSQSPERIVFERTLLRQSYTLIYPLIDLDQIAQRVVAVGRN